jgi:hypothetical protein
MPNDLTAFYQALIQINADRNDLWPGFSPQSTPFVVYDGQQTVLFHASPAVDGWHAQGDTWRWPGRHPDVSANTAALLDGRLLAASLLLNTLPELSSRDLAALAVHEAFHVYQAGTGTWEADELAVFTYPLTSTDVLVSRAMETEALIRALASEDWKDAAALALAWRDVRIGLLAPEHAAYERGMERVEGLAHYVELKFTGALPAFPEPDFPAQEIRQRAYSVGAAYALLLDRLGGDWKAEATQGAALDELLGARLGVSVPVENPSPEVWQWAHDAANQVQTEREQARQAFDTQPVSRLILRSGTPLWPQGFDPLNVLLLEPGLVLHRRFLKFGNTSVQGEVLGGACLTISDGPDPLLSGFREVQLRGVGEFQLTTQGLSAHGAGWTLNISGGSASSTDDGWLYILG